MPTPDRVAFQIFGLDIMWYGVLIALGMVLATMVMYLRAPKHQIKPDDILDLVLFSVPMGVVGARIYYVIFEWSFYQGDLMKMINLREGGLAIHGGLILGFLTAAILCARKSIRPLNLLDVAVPGIALAQSIGRWGNYFNQEAHGGPTTLPWAIEVNGQLVHPTFLYESIWTFLLFLFLIRVDNRRKFEGQVFYLYGILYSLERFLVEGLRTDSLMLGPFKQAQVLSFTVILVFGALYVISDRKYKIKS